MLLATAIGMVVLGVVGMHQLSLGHDLVTPSVGGHQHVSAHQVEDVQRPMPGQSPSVRTIIAGIQSHIRSGGSVGDGCPGCGGHSLAFAPCLMALTLLVLTLWLAAPRVWHLPLRMRWRPGTVVILLGRWVPALSLAQLCLLRT